MGRLFGVPCREVFVALVNQIKAWRTESSCATRGEKCLYELASARPLLITAKHTSRHRDSAAFLLLSPGSCCQTTVANTFGQYCILYLFALFLWAIILYLFCPPEMCDALDLTELWSAGSGLVDAEGYKQYTNEWICLDYFTVY
ncbi:uncharacterized protein wu:fc46h12 [Pygocentrus nattereri]|uniref:uncharacterized protein wu:fc46h12 n=1 Tax=Pygocentrus nattereri TaxID=42514 RepID=UPI001891C054|nr:uncharacterized protein wu:fc46h12 [Pygocentrus nattereri]